MKFIKKYKELELSTPEEVFNYLQSNLKDTIRTYDFFVAWDKIKGNISKVEVSLNILNTLIGKKDTASTLIGIIKKYPEVVSVLPLLIAVREEEIKVVDKKGDSTYTYSFANKDSYSDKEIKHIVEFAGSCGLLKIFSDKSIKNIVDYCFGIEVGLDTNARKNRSGTTMEGLTEGYVKSICNQHKYKYIAQATVKKILAEFGYDVPTDKANRAFDFAIKTANKIYLIETNYYGGGGSKLKSVAGEFKSLFNLVKSNPKVGFIWITDGKGWQTALKPLKETFNSTDFILNLSMVNEGILSDILNKEE